MAAKASWGFTEGTEIAPGRSAIASLGGGEICEIWRAWDERLHTIVVCKMIRPDQVSVAASLRILRREADILERLAHPMIVRQLDAGLDGARPHIVLENLAASNLRRRLRRRGPLPLLEGLVLGRQLASALHYLAAEGYVHLDVKPGNLVRGRPLRLIDFGLARTRERARALRRPVGTAKYMAPELCIPGQRGEIGPAADIWGLGITLYEALSGKLPFPPATDLESRDPQLRYPQLRNDPAPLPDGLPGRLREFVYACLDRTQGERPTTAQITAELKSLEESAAKT